MRANTAKSPKNSCRRPGTNLKVFLAGSSLRALSTTTKVMRCKANVWTARKKWALLQQDSDLFFGVFGDPGSEQTWKYKVSIKAIFTLWQGRWDKFASVMLGEFVTSKHPVFKCSNILQTCIPTSKKGKPGGHFKNEPGNILMLVNVVLACNQFSLSFAVKTWRFKLPSLD